MEGEEEEKGGEKGGGQREEGFLPCPRGPSPHQQAHTCMHTHEDTHAHMLGPCMCMYVYLCMHPFLICNRSSLYTSLSAPMLYLGVLPILAYTLLFFQKSK